MPIFEVETDSGTNRIVASQEFVEATFPGQWTLVAEPAPDLSAVRAQRIALIKREAYELIAATDWKLSRAREREDAAWDSLETVNQILAVRESIRRSSNAAEDAVMALEDADAIRSFTWSVDVPVATPRRLTKQMFLERLSATESSNIMAASSASPAVAAWILRLENAALVNLDDPSCVSGMQALEAAGLLAEGRAAEILA